MLRRHPNPRQVLLVSGSIQARCPTCGQQVSVIDGAVGPHKIPSVTVMQMPLGLFAVPSDATRDCPHVGKAPTWREG